jgi:hypothetical protein
LDPFIVTHGFGGGGGSEGGVGGSATQASPFVVPLFAQYSSVQEDIHVPPAAAQVPAVFCEQQSQQPCCEPHFGPE